MQKQKTLATSFSMQGKGLHTGLDIQITFHPAPENHGYKIKRVDLEGEPVIDAVAENVAGTQRGTVLSKNGIQVSTIEHAMAALYAYEIDNCLIEVNSRFSTVVPVFSVKRFRKPVSWNKTHRKIIIS